MRGVPRKLVGGEAKNGKVDCQMFVMYFQEYRIDSNVQVCTRNRNVHVALLDKKRELKICMYHGNRTIAHSHIRYATVASTSVLEMAWWTHDPARRGAKT
jgi:hypothetical protein